MSVRDALDQKAGYNARRHEFTIEDIIFLRSIGSSSTMTPCDEILSRKLFAIFPDNPGILSLVSAI
jgi:hypothetical protein